MSSLDALQRKLEQKQRAQGIRPPSVCRLTPAALLSQPQPKLAPVGEPEAAEVGLGERDPRDPLDTLVAPGNYTVAMVDWDEAFVFGRMVWFVEFSIVDQGPDFGRPLLRFYNRPRGPRLARSSSLWRDFLRLTGTSGHRRAASSRHSSSATAR